MKSKSLPVIVMIACLSLTIWIGITQKAHATPPSRFEYKTVFTDPDLNQAGLEGWELVSVTPPVLKPDGSFLMGRLFYLKRSK